MGDYNVNTLDKFHYIYDDLSDLISVHNLHQFVNQPTYHKPNIVPSLLDHIYSNDPDLISQVDYLSPSVLVIIPFYIAGSVFVTPSLLLSVVPFGNTTRLIGLEPMICSSVIILLKGFILIMPVYIPEKGEKLQDIFINFIFKKF